MHNKLLIFLLICFCFSACKEQKNMLIDEQAAGEIVDQFTDEIIISEVNENEDHTQPAKKERITSYSYDLPPDIVDETNDQEYDGDLYFFNLNVNDSIETVKKKLESHGCEFEEGTDNYIGLHKIWNKGMILEERININFIICFYNKKLYSFTKGSLSLEEAQAICTYYGRDFDVSTLKFPQSFVIKKADWELKICNDGDMNGLIIYNPEIAKKIQEINSKFE